MAPAQRRFGLFGVFRLHDHRHAVQQDDFVAPAELVLALS
jgi:hypothetical protein